MEPGFVVQVGDPQSRQVSDPLTLQRLGTGYPGYRIADEFGAGLSHDRTGIVSMANINADGSYPDTGGSQFFITFVLYYEHYELTSLLLSLQTSFSELCSLHY